MKQLNKPQSILFLSGGILMVVGAGCFAFMWQESITSIVFLAGAMLFSALQAMQTYDGNNIAVKRLRKIMTFADICFVLAGVLMLDKAYGIFRPWFDNYVDYYQIAYNKWVVLLLIAAVLEMYSITRIANELKKEKH